LVSIEKALLVLRAHSCDVALAPRAADDFAHEIILTPESDKLNCPKRKVAKQGGQGDLRAEPVN